MCLGHGELWGQERPGFLGSSQLSIRLLPYTQRILMMEQNNRLNVPGSRMARGLRAQSECSASAEDPDGVVSGSRRSASDGALNTAEHGSQNRAEAEHGSQESFSCGHCPREFRTKSGLGLHVARAHIEVANRAVNVERVKARWSVEEVRLMARAEASATLAGDVLFMNQHLQERIPDRSLEAIKGKRRQEAYREMVRGFCQEMRQRCAMSSAADIDEGDGTDAAMIGAETVPITAMETAINERSNDLSAHQPPPEQSSQRLRDHVQQLIEQSTAARGFEADTLVGTARDALL